MISKQAKDFINDLPEVGGESFKLELDKNWIPFQKINFNDEDVIMVDMNVLPKGSDFDIDAFMKLVKQNPTQIIQSKPSLKESIEVLCNELKDEDYYRSWSANIAMAFKDLVQYNVKFDDGEPITILNRESIHVLANNAADNFLKQLMK